MNKKRIAIVVLSVLLGIALCITGFVFAANEGKSFVLISKDYLDHVLLPDINKKNEEQDTAVNQLKNEYTQLLEQYNALNQSYNELLKRIESGEIPGGSGNGGTTVTSGYTKVKIPEGKSLRPEGTNDVCLEILVDRGNAKIVSPLQNQGILDASTGTMLENGASVPLNHYLLIPHANDGRGISAVDSDVWVLVRGEYVIE